MSLVNMIGSSLQYMESGLSCSVSFLLVEVRLFLQFQNSYKLIINSVGLKFSKINFR